MFWNFNKMQLGTSYFYEPHPWSSCRITNVSMREPLVMVQLLLFIFTGRNEVVAKVMFLHVCVILFTGGVSGKGEPPPEQTPPRADTPPEQIPPPPPGSTVQHTVNERPVSILLECILVRSVYTSKPSSMCI